ncbi:hypothetical protein L6R52_30875 [Myxococcota bacterium]|nr:hypothetical protein [Myxococcota bacterium]
MPSLSAVRFTGLRAPSSIPDAATAEQLALLERTLAQPGTAATVLRQLRGLVTVDPGLKRAWELGVQSFRGLRYDYVPPPNVQKALNDGRTALAEGDRTTALRLARQLVSHDPELKQGWELGLATFD